MSGFLNSIGRFRAPRKSPTTTPTTQSFDPAASTTQPSEFGTQPVYSTSTYPQQRPPSPPPASKPLYLCQPFVKAALVKGTFKTIVAPPKYVDVNEWVAINIFDFFNNLNHFYGVITEFCTIQNCPCMSAASSLNFTWPDQAKRLVSLPAPTYIDYVMSWVQKLMDDETIFPTKSGRDFPPTFPSTAKHIYKQLFRIYAHIYHGHFPEILHLSLEAHFNSLFAHFIAFGKEYDLLDSSDVRDLRGRGGGVTVLADKWAELGVLEG